MTYHRHHVQRAAEATFPRNIARSLSTVLAAAISDARSLDPQTYRPNCVAWHSFDEDGQCQVCLAGSLIAGTLQAPSNMTLTPHRFASDTPRILEAVNYIRDGQWVMAYRRFHSRWPSSPTYERLNLLDTPSNSNFIGWHAFRTHLDFLEAILPELLQIEQDDRIF